MKDRQWRDYWDVELGVSYIPIDKLDPQVNMIELEEGGVFDEDTMPEWMKTMRGVAPDSQMPLTAPPPAAAAALTAQFIPVPEGMPPPPNALGVPPPTSASSIPTPASIAGPPPGMPPFGLPPPGGPPPAAAAAAAAAVAGLMPPGPPPNLLPGQPGVLPPPGGPGLIGATPHNLLLGAPISQPPTGGPSLIGAPPPGLPGFDASQPPPVPGGMRLPFPPPPGGIPARMPPPLLPEAAAGKPLMGEAPKAAIGADDEAKDDAPPPAKRRDRGERRGSRWGSEKPETVQDEESVSIKNDRAGAGPPDLASRLRSLAGMSDPHADRPNGNGNTIFGESRLLRIYHLLDSLGARGFSLNKY